MKNQRIKLAILSAGLGHINRGFEVSASRLFDGLRNDLEIDARLFCGGSFSGGHRCVNLPRNGRAARFLRRCKLIHDGCRMEQISFAAGVMIRLIAWQPDVVWTQESELARTLKRFRSLLKLKFQILFCDGAPNGPEASSQFDYIQHLHPASFDDAVQYGVFRNRMFVMPHWIVDFPEPAIESVNDLRQRLKLDKDDFVVVSVAAWNRHHKRLDYLIEEVAAVQSDRIKLVLCGQEESDTPILKTLGLQKLPGKIHWITLKAGEIPILLKLASVFVLASLNEGLGMALIESAVMGTPTIAHNHSAARHILEEKGIILDLSKPLNLKAMLETMLLSSWPADARTQLRASARARFFHSALLPLFRERVLAIAARQPLIG